MPIERLNHPQKDEPFWVRIADRAEELANLTRPYSRSVARMLELAALLALEEIERKL